ncbi:MAG: ParA family protein [Acidobacteria bacterium]|jgi:hypothetical protein|nr:ParA family protein [Acidobacteriota bacterium]
MVKTKNGKHLIIVHSIKGGSGKTTISLALAQYFGKNDPGKVCYIDTDIAGVGTITLVGEDNKPGQSLTDFIMVNPFDNPQFFKTDFEDAPASLFKEFVHCPDDSMYRHFNAIFCSEQQKDMKQALQATADMFFSQDVEKKMKVLLEKLYGDGIDTIIIDTSPGMQGLTQVIFKIAKDSITNGLHFSENRQINVNVIHVCVLTNNFAHIGGLWKFLYDERKYFFEEEPKSKFVLVLNQVPLGVEFQSVPPEGMKYDKYQIDEIKEDASKIEEFAGYLKGTIETYGRPLIYRAFREYFSLKENFFYPTFLNQLIKMLKT